MPGYYLITLVTTESTEPNTLLPYKISFHIKIEYYYSLTQFILASQNHREGIVKYNPGNINNKLIRWDYFLQVVTKVIKWFVSPGHLFARV